MSPTVAFPDFSAHREHGVGQRFACMLQVGDVGPAWVHVAGDLDISSAPRLEQALRHTDTTPPRSGSVDVLEIVDLDAFELLERELLQRVSPARTDDAA
jgi:hypothetical protein